MAEPSQSDAAPIALVTGASRKIGIAAAIARRLAINGWDVASTHWRPYDQRMPWGSTETDIDELDQELRSLGARTHPMEADLGDPTCAEAVVAEATRALGSVRALILVHTESTDSSIADTTVESFDRHYAVNARANWLLIKAFAERYTAPHGAGRVVAITSDHTAHNLPYGSSKGALDRIVLAAAAEYRDLGITANVINPGATDTGWMSDELVEQVRNATLLGRVGQPDDCARLVAFLASDDGRWINGQLLYSNGGLR